MGLITGKKETLHKGIMYTFPRMNIPERKIINNTTKYNSNKDLKIFLENTTILEYLKKVSSI